MAAGHTVTGWNRSRDKAEPLIAAGMAGPTRRARSREAPRSCSRSSPMSRRCSAVALGDDGIVSGPAQRGGIYIDMSTIEPDVSRAVAAEFAKAGSIMLDARSPAARSR